MVRRYTVSQMEADLLWGSWRIWLQRILGDEYSSINHVAIDFQWPPDPMLVYVETGAKSKLTLYAPEPFEDVRSPLLIAELEAS